MKNWPTSSSRGCRWLHWRPSSPLWALPYWTSTNRITNKLCLICEIQISDLLFRIHRTSASITLNIYTETVCGPQLTPVAETGAHAQIQSVSLWNLRMRHIWQGRILTNVTLNKLIVSPKYIMTVMLLFLSFSLKFPFLLVSKLNVHCRCQTNLFNYCL